MRKLAATIAGFLVVITVSTAQVDLKINPLGLFVNQAEVSVEVAIGEKFGIGASNAFIYANIPYTKLLFDERYKQRGHRVRLYGRYYFNNNTSADGANCGIYLGPRSFTLTQIDTPFDNEPVFNFSAFSVGGTIGYKHVFNNRVVAEFIFGLGYGFNSELSQNDNVLTEIPSILLGIESTKMVTIGYRLGKD